MRFVLFCCEELTVGGGGGGRGGDDVQRASIDVVVGCLFEISK